MPGMHVCFNCLFEFPEDVEDDEKTQELPVLREVYICVSKDGVNILHHKISSDTTIIGRSKQADIHLDDIHISREHLAICLQHDVYVAKDLSALNPCKINEETLNGEMIIDEKSIIDVCGYILRLTPERN